VGCINVGWCAIEGVCFFFYFVNKYFAFGQNARLWFLPHVGVVLNLNSFCVGPRKPPRGAIAVGRYVVAQKIVECIPVRMYDLQKNNIFFLKLV
jgi:hypothetical protein